MSPEKILNVDLFYLPKCTALFLVNFWTWEPVSNFRLNRFLYRRGLTGKFILAWRVLKSVVLTRGFFLYSSLSFPGKLRTSSQYNWLATSRLLDRCTGIAEVGARIRTSLWSFQVWSLLHLVEYLAAIIFSLFTKPSIALSSKVDIPSRTWSQNAYRNKFCWSSIGKLQLTVVLFNTGLQGTDGISYPCLRTKLYYDFNKG